MNDVMSVQLAISKLHMQSLLEQPLSETVAMQALAELNAALAELEATNDELLKQNETLAVITRAHELEASRYRDLFERMPVPYLVTDGWGVVAEANTAAEALLNVPRGLLHGKPISVFVPPELRSEFRERINKLPLAAVWEVVLQPRRRDRITVQIDVAPLPGQGDGESRLGWVLQNTTPLHAAASAERLLARETMLRLEAQAASMRLRALTVGLETMAHDKELPVRQRVTALLEALVPRFADHLRCHLPGDPERAIDAGDVSYAGHVLQTVVLAPRQEPGRLIAKRAGTFSTEDAAILQSAANGISLLLYST